MTTSTIEPSDFEVHVLGAGKGESIVLRLPNGQWGVVDCYAASTTGPNTNPTIAFLRDCGVKRLQFVCLTHPHDDHFLGMTSLIDEFKPREFWRPGCLSPEHVKLIAKYYRIASIANGVDYFTKSANELVGIFARIRDGVKRREINVKRVHSLMTLYPTPAEQTGNFRIECIAPSGNQIEHYEGAIWSCIGPNGEIAGTLTRSHHNNISLVLKIVFGETSVVLGGDLEKEGWLDVIREYGQSHLNACAIKVSHHGSPNGFCSRLWEYFSSKGKPVAVIAPSRPHKLPTPDALEHIRSYALEIYATCSLESGGVTPSGPTSKPPVDSRLAIRHTFAATPKVGVSSGIGCCSLSFNDKGQCEVQLIPPAHQLRFEVAY